MPVADLLTQNPETPEKRGRAAFYDQCENIFAAAINLEVKLLLYWALICRHGGTCLYRVLSTMGGGVMPVDHCGGMVSVERARAALGLEPEEDGNGAGKGLGLWALSSQRLEFLVIWLLQACGHPGMGRGWTFLWLGSPQFAPMRAWPL